MAWPRLEPVAPWRPGLPAPVARAAPAASSGAAAGLPFGHPDPAVVHPTYDGFTLWLGEDFTQPLDLTRDPIWIWSDGGFQTHRFAREAITFESGKLVLTLSDTQAPSSCSYSNTGVVPERARILDCGL